MTSQESGGQELGACGRHYIPHVKPNRWREEIILEAETVSVVTVAKFNLIEKSIFEHHESILASV